MVSVSGGFKEVAKSVPYIKEIAVSLIMTLLIVGVFVYQATSSSIDVGSTTNTAMVAVETGLSGWSTSLIAVIGTIIGLIVLVVIMKLLGGNKKGSNM